MRHDLEKAVAARWDLYLRYKADGASYSALVRLGEIANALRHGLMSGALARKWRRTVGEVTISEAELAQAVAKAGQDAARLKHILSIGEKFIYEEQVLLLTLRIQLELFSDFLRERGMAVEFDPESADSKFREVARSRGNAHAFRSAQASAKRNWGLPLRSPWLEPLQ